MTPELKKIIESLNKKMGQGSVVLASEVHGNTVPRITSGSLTLDVILGGGWPGSQWVEIIGDASSGKTAIALKTIAANQHRNPEFTSVWIAAEKWVPEYATMCGVDLSRVLLIETNVMEEAFDAMIRFADSREVDCVVLDSYPALVPSAEDEKAMEEFTVGRGAMLFNKFWRKVGKATKRSLVDEERPLLGIVLNQWRMKIGVLHGDPRTSPGGQGKDFAYFVRCEVRRDEWIEVGSGTNKIRVGQTIKVRTIKNKTHPPQQVAQVDFIFRDGYIIPPGEYDFAKEIVSLSLINGVVERRGGWYYYGSHKWQGADGIVQAIREDIDLRESIENEVRDTLISI